MVLQTALVAAADASDATTGDGEDDGSDVEALLAKVAPEHRAVAASVNSAIALCKRNTNPLTAEGDLEHNDSAKLWFAVLDKLVAGQRDAKSAPRLVSGRTSAAALAAFEFGGCALC